MTLLALRYVALGEIEIIKNSLGVSPLFEEVVVLEEVVMTERCVGDHQRLHGRGIFLHQIGNTRRAVDHDLLGEAHKALAEERLVMAKMLAEQPLPLQPRQPYPKISTHHSLLR